MIPRPSSSCHGLTAERSHGDGIWHPVSKDHFCWDGLSSILGIELDVEVIALDEGINRDTFVLGIDIPFCGDHERNLAALEVEIFWSENCYEGEIGVRVIIGTVFSFNVSVEVALDNTVDVHIG